MRRTQLGFTLVELVVVILLISIVAVTARSRYSGTGAFETHVARDQGITFLRQLQVASMQFDAFREFSSLSTEQQRAVECRGVFATGDRFGSPESVMIGASSLDCYDNSVFLSTEETGITFSVTQGLSDSSAALYFDLLGRPIQVELSGAERIQHRVCGGDALLTNNSQICRYQFSGESTLSICINQEGFIDVCENF
ncbi:prepilin-type N-terminal cleavage/methylation domain-containing protein [Thaumasiovibrio subtropicus]|uniref:prepilin-type N-terminal cleavage/methylation domain-containing protein n=1 Tax=Thaumasiovibrio subtropicus TaxID=1891207 RepID=UPI000B34B59C|nr:prepilin-type N-terminal cleavage/methylation domain-containing protein [Thaumasiovibrio subtropicus]